MMEREQYLQGIGLSLLVHGLIVGVVLAFWLHQPKKKAAESLHWDVSMFGAPPPAPAPPVIDSPPEEPDLTPEPTVDTFADSTPAAAVIGGGAPSFGAPKLGLPLGDSSNAIAVPIGSVAGTGTDLFRSLPSGGGGMGGAGSALGAPDFGMQPVPTVRVPPTYPLEARKKKIEGWVRVELTVLENGAVTDVRVRDAKPQGVFDQAAIAAVAQWKFRPATENGKPVRRRAAQTLRFELQN